MNLLTRLSRVVYRRAVPELIGIRIKEFVALVYLRESGKAAQQKLAETMMMDANNCVILLNGLEEDGLIERNRDPLDRRRHIVEITSRGLATIDSINNVVGAVERELFADLDAGELELLRELLNRVRISADDPPCGAPE